jgi:hypothetical protein
MGLRYPHDRFPYPRDARSRVLGRETEPGLYVYVQDEAGEIYVVPDSEPNLHPRVLGGGVPARYAGDLKLGARGVVEDLTNLSGNFRFRGKGGLLAVAELLRARGLIVQSGAVRWFPPDGGDLVILA